MSSLGTHDRENTQEFDAKTKRVNRLHARATKDEENARFVGTREQEVESACWDFKRHQSRPVGKVQGESLTVRRTRRKRDQRRRRSPVDRSSCSIGVCSVRALAYSGAVSRVLCLRRKEDEGSACVSKMRSPEKERAETGHQ